MPFGKGHDLFAPSPRVPWPAQGAPGAMAWAGLSDAVTWAQVRAVSAVTDAIRLGCRASPSRGSAGLA